MHKISRSIRAGWRTRRNLRWLAGLSGEKQGVIVERLVEWAYVQTEETLLNAGLEFPLVMAIGFDGDTDRQSGSLPAEKGDPVRPLSFRVSPPVADIMKRLSERYMVSYSEIVRELIDWTATVKYSDLLGYGVDLPLWSDAFARE